MPVVTIWKWKDLDEESMVEAMGAVTALDYPEGYQNWVFADGSGGVSITPDGEDLEPAAIRSHVFSKWMTREVHNAMPEADAISIAPQIVELLAGLNED